MRKSIEIVIPDDDPGRDRGKTFVVTEMAAIPAEEWAQRAYGAMVRAGLKAPQPGILTGMAAIAVYGVSALLSAPWTEVQPLMREMLDKCARIKEEAFPLGRPLTEDDIEEVTTILRLREEAVKLHTDFSIAANVLAAVVQAMTWMDAASSATATSPTTSAPSSAPTTPRSRSSKRSTRSKTRG